MSFSSIAKMFLLNLYANPSWCNTLSALTEVHLILDYVVFSMIVPDQRQVDKGKSRLFHGMSASSFYT